MFPKHRLLLGLLTLFCAFALAIPALSSADEAGDDIAHATGPLAGATTYSGRMDTDTDHDWWFFYTNPQRPIDIAVTKLPGGSCSWIGVNLLDGDGNKISEHDPDTNTTTHFNFTTAVTSRRYYLEIDRGSCTGGSYQILIQDADAVTSTPPGSQPTVASANETEPDDTIAQAFGPLLGGVTYGGTFNTDTDHDWWVFYTNPQRPLDAAVTNLGGPCGWIGVNLYDGDGNKQSEKDPDPNTTSHFNFTTPAGSRRYYIEVDRGGCHGQSYLLRIDPADALTQVPPPPDADRDGIPDASDPCPQKAGGANGCPDSDGDGVTDDVDACLDDRGAAPSGCPDGDRDGVVDKYDKCPTTAGKASAAGCPDRDGDGVADVDDHCRTIAGPAPMGCPAKQRYATLVTLRHAGRRFSGRVSSSGPGCAGSRRIVLRRVGSGTRSFGATVTRSNGSFTIVLGRTARGRFYAVVAERSLKTRLCRVGSSRTLRR
jgi:hypothetical protein